MVKSVKNLILTGFMGSGKSDVGKLLSERMSIPLHDMDGMIASDEGMSISDIFEQKGELYFRDAETNFLKNIQFKSPFILSTGGGVVVREENREMLKVLGLVIYLKATPGTIFKRLVDDKSRPLLQVDNLREKIELMIQQRGSAYSDCNIVQNTDGLSVDGVVEHLIARV